MLMLACTAVSWKW